MIWRQTWRSPIPIGVICLLAVSTAVAQQPLLTLATRDTVLTLSADPAKPRIISLACPGGVVWKSERPDKLIDKVLIDGHWEPVRWRLKSVDDNRAGSSISVVYESSEPRLRLDWEWHARARSGPIEHTIRFTNLEKRAVALPLQASFTFDWAVPLSKRLRLVWIEKGAGAPSPEGTHEALLTEGDHWEAVSSTYARDGEPREAIPWMLVGESTGRQSGWYLGIEFSGRTRLTLSRRGTSLAGEADLNPSPAPFLTRLPAGGSFATPTTRQAFALYKTHLRPLIRGADLYHIAPRPDGKRWDGVEYFAASAGQGVVYAFRGATPGEYTHTYLLRGLRSDRRYALHFNDRTSPDREASGTDLMVSGILVRLPQPQSSELVFIRELRSQVSRR